MSIRPVINDGSLQPKAGLEVLHDKPEPGGSNRDTARFLIRLETVIRERWRKYRKAIRRCRNHFSNTSVHEVRIAMRRFIATLELPLYLMDIHEFERTRKAIKKQLAWLGPLRDIQVQRVCLHEYRTKGFKLDTYLELLDKKEARLIRKLREKLGKVSLESHRTCLREGLKRFRRKSGSFPPKAQGYWLSLILEYPLHRVRQRLNIAADDPASIHRLRVACKRLRYTAEALRPLLLGVCPDYLRELRSHQDDMGQIQDIHVLRNDLAVFLKRQKQSTRRDLGAFRAELKQLLQKRVEAYMARKPPEIISIRQTAGRDR